MTVVFACSHLPMPSLLLGLLRGGLLGGRHLLRDEERTHDAHPDTLGAPGAAIRTADRAPALLQPPVLDGTQRWNANQALLAITAMRALRPLLHDARDQLAARCAQGSDLVRLGVVGRMAAIEQALNHRFFLLYLW